MTQPIELIVGLGNPDPEYLTTRHNAGFWFVDALAREHDTGFNRDRKLHGESCEVRIAGQRVRLLKPTTYMNLSGEAVSAAINYYKLPTDVVLVVYDEIDLPPGTVRLKFDGGSAGHNGIRSVVQYVGSAFWRMRIGVGHPGSKEQVVRHVLKRATADDEDAILDTIRRGIDILPTLIEKGGERAQNVLHTREPLPDETADAAAHNGNGHGNGNGNGNDGT